MTALRQGRHLKRASWELVGCLLLLQILFLLHPSGAVKYVPCEVTKHVENRELHVATCDSRDGWKEFMALKVWNITGEALRKQGVKMENACKGLNWGAHGFLTKPLSYLNYIKRILSQSPHPHLVNVILMDSDTFWAVDDVNTIWNKFDCARGKKDVVLSTEMSCWVGRFCTAEDLQRWYSNVQDTPSFSPFANSGVVIGSAVKIQKMLEHVIAHNKSYYIKYKKFKFDDQYAIADYAISVAPQDIALDYHQQLLASFSINAPTDPYEDGWPFVCKFRNGTVCTSCVVWTKKMSRVGHFHMMEDRCLLRRKLWDDMPLKEEMETLAVDPIIWHGNGEGKGMYMHYGHSAFLCYLKNHNMTQEDHSNTFG
jgi:hypothetical protein